MPLRAHRKVPHRAFGPVRDDILRDYGGKWSILVRGCLEN